jgi:hypothetical protein
MDPRYEQSPGMSALFDLSFTRFVTIGVVKIVYILGMVVLAILLLLMLIGAFSQGVGMGLLALIVLPIVGFLELLFLRIWLEIIVCMFRIAQNTTVMANAMVPPATGGFPVGPTDQPNPPIV